jgi:hypothetical protein
MGPGGVEQAPCHPQTRDRPGHSRRRVPPDTGGAHVGLGPIWPAGERPRRYAFSSPRLIPSARIFL